MDNLAINNEKNIESFLVEKIMYELKNFKFKRNSISYEFLIDCILIIIISPWKIKDFSKYVYEEVAVKYKTEAKNVMWNINKLVNLMYLNTDSKLLEEKLNLYEGEHLSAKAFIITIARKIRTIMLKSEEI